MHREPVVKAAKVAQTAKAAQTAAEPRTVVRWKTLPLKTRARRAKSAVGQEAGPELMPAAADRAHRVHRADGRRYGCFVTASWFRCGCTPVSTMEH